MACWLLDLSPPQVAHLQCCLQVHNYGEAQIDPCGVLQRLEQNVSHQWWSYLQKAEESAEVLLGQTSAEQTAFLCQGLWQLHGSFRQRTCEATQDLSWWWWARPADASPPADASWKPADASLQPADHDVPPAGLGVGGVGPVGNWINATNSLSMLGLT